MPIEVHADWHARTAGELNVIYPEKMLFTFTEFGGLAGLRRWAEVAKLNRPTLSRLMATKYAPSMFLSDRVMNVAAAVEGYDREKYQDRKTYLARVTRCADQAGDPFLALVGDVDAWCRLLKDARNDIAHDNARLDTTSANHLVLSYSSYFLLVLCLLRDAGAGPAVFRRIENQSRFRWVGAQTRAVMDGGTEP